MSQSYCRRMYLLSEEQYKLFYNLKTKNDENQTTKSTETADVSSPNQNASNLEEQTPPISDSSQNPESGSGSYQNLESGSGLSNDINLKKKYSDFVKKQNLQKFVEDKNLKYLYDKILPLMKTNIELQKKAMQNNVPGRIRDYSPDLSRIELEEEEEGDVPQGSILEDLPQGLSSTFSAPSTSNLTPDIRLSSTFGPPATSNLTPDVLQLIERERAEKVKESLKTPTKKKKTKIKNVSTKNVSTSPLKKTKPQKKKVSLTVSDEPQPRSPYYIRKKQGKKGHGRKNGGEDEIAKPIRFKWTNF